MSTDTYKIISVHVNRRGKTWAQFMSIKAQNIISVLVNKCEKYDVNSWQQIKKTWSQFMLTDIGNVFSVPVNRYRKHDLSSCQSIRETWSNMIFMLIRAANMTLFQVNRYRKHDLSSCQYIRETWFQFMSIDTGSMIGGLWFYWGNIFQYLTRTSLVRSCTKVSILKCMSQTAF